MELNKKLNEYVNLINTIISNSNLENLEILFERLKNHFYSGGRIFLAGNGGSAAIALHATTDLNKLVLENKKLNAFALSSNIPQITAISNDEGYENLFEKILQNFNVDENDTLITISSSGNSKNLINLINYATTANTKIFSLLGFDGGEIKNLSVTPIIANSNINYYGPVEDIHMIIFHLFSHIIKKDLLEI